MPLPKSHMASLRANLKAHTEAVAELRRLRDTLTKEIKLREAGEWHDAPPKPEGIPGMIAWLEQVERQITAHEQQIELGRDTRWTEALAALLDNPEAAKAAARDPKNYARKVGVKLPPEIEVELSAVGGRPALTITGFNPLAPFVLHWNQDGFS